jgi:hypothetical protein
LARQRRGTNGCNHTGASEEESASDATSEILRVTGTREQGPAAGAVRENFGQRQKSKISIAFAISNYGKLIATDARNITVCIDPCTLKIAASLIRQLHKNIISIL